MEIVSMISKDVWIQIFSLSPVWFRCRLVCKAWNLWICSDSRFWGRERDEIKRSLINLRKPFESIVVKRLRDLPLRNFSVDYEHFYSPRIRLLGDIVLRFEFPNWDRKLVTTVTSYRCSDLQELNTFEITKLYGGSIPKFFYFGSEMIYSCNDETSSQIRSVDFVKKIKVLYLEDAKSTIELVQFVHPLGLISYGWDSDNVYDFEKRHLMFKFPHPFGNSVRLMENGLFLRGHPLQGSFVCYRVPFFEKESEKVIKESYLTSFGAFPKTISINSKELMGWTVDSIEIHSTETRDSLFRCTFPKLILNVILHKQNIVEIRYQDQTQSLFLWKPFSRELVCLVSWDLGKEPGFYFFEPLLPFGIVRLVSTSVDADVECSLVDPTIRC